MLNKKREHENHMNSKGKQEHTKNRKERRKEDHNNKQNKLNKLEQDHRYIFSTGMNKQSENSVQKMIQRFQQQKKINLQDNITPTLNIQCYDSELGRSLYKYIKNSCGNPKDNCFDSTKVYRFAYNTIGLKSTQHSPQIVYKPLEKISLEMSNNKTYEYMLHFIKNRQNKEEQKVDNENKEASCTNKKNNNKIFDNEDSDSEEINSHHSILHFTPSKDSHDANNNNEEEEDLFKYKDIKLSDLLKKNPHNHL